MNNQSRKIYNVGDIHSGEIFRSSKCIWHEHSLMEFIRHALRMLDYRPMDPSNKIWRRGERTVIVCLVDDVMSCKPDDFQAGNQDMPFEYKYDKNTLIITDNYISLPLAAEVCQLPASFYGIYYYEPSIQTWNPTRRFNFSINRIDHKRLKLFLELQTRTYMLCDDYDLEHLDYINFNCYLPGRNNDSAETRIENFVSTFYDQTFSYLVPTYQEAFFRHRDLMPFCNHDLTQEEADVSAWLNVVVETYSTNSSVIALSEKTFRALSLPVPFILYSGKHTMMYLQKLGFDIMPDLMTYKYDVKDELKSSDYGDKTVDFIYEGAEIVEKLRKTTPTQRCINAANHNRALLKQMHHQWPADFAAWWPETLKKIT